jgi:hypothetical protein
MADDTSALDHATTQWHEINARIGEASGNGHPADPYLLAALLDARAGWFDHLGQLADREEWSKNLSNGGRGEIRDVYAIACSYAAELDRHAAAECRFRHRIPTLFPGADAVRIGLGWKGPMGHRCPECARPWQLDRDGACPACPDSVYGITPHSAEQAATYPPGKPWTPGPDRSEDDDD